MLPSLTASPRSFARISLLIVAGLLFTSPAHAALEITPGESAVLPPEACHGESGYSLLGGSWDVCLSCVTHCELSVPSVDAYFDLLHTIGSKYVRSTIMGDFTVSDPNGSGNEVDGTIAYDVSWKGYWTLTGVFTGFNDARAEIAVALYDVTAGGKLVKKTEPPVHTMTPDGFIGIDIIDVGAGYDEGATTNSLSAKLTRGHTYRVALRLFMTGKGIANADIALDYSALDLGVKWNEVLVSVSPDLWEEIVMLKGRVDTLEAEAAELRHDLENHSHTYLTGRGVGHNNAEAQTSIAIIMEDEELSDSSWPGGDEIDTEALPVKSVVLTNYPNPFNPTTTILYALPEAGQTKIAVYNSLGQIVTTLVDGFKEAGEHTVDLDAEGLASGIYYYRLLSGRYAETRKLVLVK